MFRAVGWNCALPNAALVSAIQEQGCDTVLTPQVLTDRMGYDLPMQLPYVGLADMHRTDVVYVDVKAHRNGPLVWKRWPHLRNRTLWYRINGGKPEHVITKDGFDCGDEVNPPCPVLTPNQWYDEKKVEDDCLSYYGGCKRDKDGWWKNAYVCWPPFYRWNDYQHPREDKRYHQPMCLIHGINGWGYKDLIPAMRELGVLCYGVGAPDGLLQHREIPTRLSSTLAMVHLKSSDAPGYALYEAMAAACPIVCTRRLIWRCRMQDLLIPGETCLVFDRETHDGLTVEDIVQCRDEVRGHLQALSDPMYNRQIGEAGREKLWSLMWNEKSLTDVETLKTFLKRHYG